MGTSSSARNVRPYSGTTPNVSKNETDTPAEESRADPSCPSNSVGQVDEPHPIHGADVLVSFKAGVLRLSGELPSEKDRGSVLKEAEQYVGRGIDEVDAPHLTVAPNRKEKPGILDQTLIAAFPNREVAEFAQRYLKGRRIEAKQMELLDGSQEDKARKLLPNYFVSKVQEAFKAGHSMLIIRVDETSAFKVRELLAEETRSIWTIAMPPVPAAKPETLNV